MNSNKTLIASHDIGGAQLLGCWVKEHLLSEDIFIVAEGPADGFLRSLFPEVCFVDRSEGLDLIVSKKIDRILTSTSWASNLETEFLALGKMHGLVTVAQLDHWVNYKERFGWPEVSWKDVLPSEIWVHDEFSLELAHREFSELKNVQIINQGNLYFKFQQKNYRPVLHGKSLLVLTEPISAHYGVSLGYDEFEALVFLKRNLSKVSLHLDAIIIRPHPSEPSEKYEEICREFNKICPTTISTFTSIFEDLARSEYVVGCDTIGLYYAHLLNKKIFSMIPVQMAPQHVPLPQIWTFFDSV